MFLHQGADGLSLAGAGVAEAHVALDIGGQAQLVHAQLGIAALAVADDEQAVLFGKLCHGFHNTGIADLAFIFKEVVVLRLHAPLHEVIAVLGIDGGENHIGNFRHDLAEEGL